MATVVVFGGSFNPPHFGHAMVISWLKMSGLAEQVWLVPTYQHAFDKDLVAFETRLAWCEVMAKEIGEYCHVVDIERRMATPSFTVDTLMELQRLHPEHVFRLAVGADILEETHKWHSWPEIEQNFNPIIVGREGFDSDVGSFQFPDISSTKIRRLVREGGNIQHLVPAAVLMLMDGEVFDDE